MLFLNIQITKKVCTKLLRTYKYKIHPHPVYEFVLDGFLFVEKWNNKE